MTCFLCLQPGGMQDACPCPSSAVHVECLASFLKSGFAARCPNCFAHFTPAAVLKAQEILWEQKHSTPNILKLARAQLDADLPGDALSLLQSAAPVPAPYSLAYDVEFSRALIQTGQNERALDRLTAALGKALMGEQPSPGVDAATACRAVVLMGRAHMSLGEYVLAETVARLAVRVLEAEDADELSLDVSLQVGGDR